MAQTTSTHRQLSCMVNVAMLANVDAYADRLGLTRTAAVVFLLDRGLASVAEEVPQPALFDISPEDTP